MSEPSAAPRPPFLPLRYRRRPTNVVPVGEVAVGGDAPIRVQSMTISHTRDAAATAAEIEELVAAGCEIVRMTVASRSDAAALGDIVARVRAKGITTPFVADIHFAPHLAMDAVEVVDKVRINPGNFVDRKKFDVREIPDDEFEAARAKIRDTFGPLVRRAAERGVALRVGVNHGSLADRMVNRYGDSPLGMVESALEYLRVCVEEDFRDVVISMKSSNPIVMIQAYRLLVARMRDESMDFPIHLGVTEAGEGREGRVKSAVGIGALLEDGIGDTIRVSLTEAASREVPVARALADRYEPRRIARASGEAGPSEGGAGEPGAEEDSPADAAVSAPGESPSFDPFTYRRRIARRVEIAGQVFGAGEPPRVEVHAGSLADSRAVAERAATFDPGADRVPEVFEIEVEAPADLEALLASGERPVVFRSDEGRAAAVSLRLHEAAMAALPTDPGALGRVTDRVTVPQNTLDPDAAQRLVAAGREGVAILVELPAWTGDPVSWRERVLDRLTPFIEGGVTSLLAGIRLADTYPASAPVRAAAALLDGMGLDLPFVLVDDGLVDDGLVDDGLVDDGAPVSGSASSEERDPEWVVDPAVRLGSSLCDGFGDAVRIDDASTEALDLAYDVLQASRVRTSKAEFISCPSCGRTLFDLESTSRKIRELTGHLKGVKIGVMGCLVNGPGEMADADFGYVGWKTGKVNLYVGQKCVVENVPEAEAGERLVELIREHGRWVDPPVPVDA